MSRWTDNARFLPPPWPGARMIAPAGQKVWALAGKPGESYLGWVEFNDYVQNGGLNMLGCTLDLDHGPTRRECLYRYTLAKALHGDKKRRVAGGGTLTWTVSSIDNLKMPAALIAARCRLFVEAGGSWDLLPEDL